MSSESHAVWLRIVADHGDVNEKQKERLYAAAARIDELEASEDRKVKLMAEAADFIEDFDQRHENLSRLQHGTYRTLEHARTRIDELEAALREIDSIWNGPAGKDYPSNTNAGRAMWEIARRTLGDNNE